jgi:virulence factor Mce-like protein
MTRRGSASIVASPALVGAVTVLIAIISVFLAYNANQGLPFVPTYDLRAELPGGSNLVVGNEVRMGGFRVGVVDKIEPATSRLGEAAQGQGVDQRAIALVHLKLDKTVEELPVDTRVQIRPRSALGLKYISLTAGRSDRTFAAGSRIPLTQSTKPTELDEFFSIQNPEFRKNIRTVYEGYGTALSGRGTAINEVIRDLNPFLRRLEPVMRSLSDPDTELRNFFREAGRTSGQIAPVARNYASLFVNMATTFEALSRHPDRLRGMMERLRPTLDTGIESFRVQRPFLRDTAELSKELRPVAVEMERSLPRVADAFEVGAPVQAKAPRLYRHTRNVFRAVDDLAENPNTLLGLRDLRRTLEVATPLVEYVAPYQTVCNYWNYYWTAISEHVSETVSGGTGQRSMSKSGNNTQDNRVNVTDGDRPVDVPANHPNPKDPRALEPGNPPPALQALHGGAYGSAIDAQGNADCEVGQRGYVVGPSVPDGRYPPSNDATLGGGSHVVQRVPGISGPTYKARELGIDNLEDVP